MKIKKKNGKIEDFNVMKIITVLHRANKKDGEGTATAEQIRQVANKVAQKAKAQGINKTEEIESLVETTLIEENLVELTKNYILGCYEKKNLRYKQTLDDSILGIINEENDEVASENANKNPTLLSTQRDYMAGELSKDIARRFIFTPEIIKAHDEGIVHIHDMDYVSMRLHNCELVNIEDMLQNGTVINNVKIDNPKSLMTAATVVSQISAVVASSSYGGQSINLAHLAPFVDVSRQKNKEIIKENFMKIGLEIEDEKINELAEIELRKEIKDSMQTMQYQWSTISSTNGQAPFVSLFMYLGDAKNKQEEKDLAMLIEEVLKQRIQGVKNEEGVYVGPTFPKLIFVTDEDNIHEDSEYYWLLTLAAECTSKRLVPDYVSAKKMKELKDGDVYSPMGKQTL